jgi:hypothetical protein
MNLLHQFPNRLQHRNDNIDCRVTNLISSRGSLGEPSRILLDLPNRQQPVDAIPHYFSSGHRVGRLGSNLEA